MLKEDELDPDFTELPNIDKSINEEQLPKIKGRAINSFQQNVNGRNPGRAINSFQSNTNPRRAINSILSENPRLLDIMETEQANFDFTLPFHNYEGPGTKFVTNLYNKLEPVNNTDKLAMKHDLQYTLDPSQLGQLKADLDAIISGFGTPLSSFPDVLSRIALELGLTAKTMLTPSPIYQIYKQLVSVKQPTDMDKMLILQLYNQMSNPY